MNQPPEVINDLQPVDRACAGWKIPPGIKGQIDRKYRAWCKRRGFKTSQFVERMDFRSYGRNEE